MDDKVDIYNLNPKEGAQNGHKMDSLDAMERREEK